MVKVRVRLTSTRERLDLLELDAYPLSFGACRAHADFNSLRRVAGQEFGGTDYKRWLWG